MSLSSFRRYSSSSPVSLRQSVAFTHVYFSVFLRTVHLELSGRAYIVQPGLRVPSTFRAKALLRVAICVAVPARTALSLPDVPFGVPQKSVPRLFYGMPVFRAADRRSLGKPRDGLSGPSIKILFLSFGMFLLIANRL